MYVKYNNISKPALAVQQKQENVTFIQKIKYAELAKIYSERRRAKIHLSDMPLDGNILWKSRNSITAATGQ